MQLNPCRMTTGAVSALPGHDRAENSDRGEWYWGGTFCIPHEVVATSDGQLDVKLPEECM